MHPKLQSNTERALVACRLWMHIGFIGATALAAGLLQLFDGEGKWLWALALALLGGVLAAASWRRALTILEHAEWPQPSPLMHRVSRPRAPLPSNPDAAR